MSKEIPLIQIGKATFTPIKNAKIFIFLPFSSMNIFAFRKIRDILQLCTFSVEQKGWQIIIQLYKSS